MRSIPSVVLCHLGTLAVSSSVLVGCSTDPHDSHEATATARQAVVGAMAPELSWSISIGIERGGVLYDGGMCSGTLVAPDIVLTAAHCVSVVAPTNDDCGLRVIAAQQGNLVAIANDATSPLALAGFSHRARKVVVPAATKKMVCANDIALVFLEAPFAGVLPRVPSLVPTTEGDRIVSVGFGMTCNEDDAGCAWGARRKAAPVAITFVTTPPAEFATPNGTVHRGDSGGGAMSEDLSTVVGIISAGTGDQDAFTDVGTHADWLKSTVVAESQAEGTIAPAWAGVVPAEAAADPSAASAPDPPAPSQAAVPAPATSSSACAMSGNGESHGSGAPWLWAIGVATALAWSRRRRR